MKKLIFSLLFLLLAPCAAKAQVQLFGGYSYLRLDTKPGSANLNGWEASGTWNHSWFGLTADFSGHYGTPFGPTTSLHSFLFGPQLSLPTPVFSPFVHALIGASRITTGGASDTSFATALGGGIDTKIAPFLSFRVIQVDYLDTRFGSTTHNNLRISTGLVLRF
jgi:hypothetical protein